MMSPDHKAGLKANPQRRLWATSIGLTGVAAATILGFAFFSSDDCTTITVTSVDGAQTVTRTCT